MLNYMPNDKDDDLQDIMDALDIAELIGLLND